MNFLIGVLIAYLIYRYVTDERLCEKVRKRRRRKYDLDEMRYMDQEEYEVYSYLKDKYDK